jgi:hypothetical protein
MERETIFVTCPNNHNIRTQESGVTHEPVLQQFICPRCSAPFQRLMPFAVNPLPPCA